MAQLTRTIDPAPPFVGWLKDSIEQMATGPANTEFGSLGTLGLALRELGRRDAQQTQLRELEEKIGAGAFLSLLQEHVDLPSFLRILASTSVDFSCQLLKNLKAGAVSAMLQRTRDRQSSLGTLNLALYELGRRDAQQTQLRELEEKIGAEAFLSLLQEHADLPSFLRILAATSVDFSESLIQSVDSAFIARLIDRTIALGSSLSSMGFSMRYLRRQLPESADRLEAVIGANNLWRLFFAYGNLNDLAALLPAVGLPLRDAVTSLEQADELRWRAVVDRSDLYAICRFARDCGGDLGEIVHHRLTGAVSATLTRSLHATSWSAFSSSLAIIEKLAPSSLRSCIEAGARERIAQLGPDDLRAEGLMEAQALLYSVRSYRPDLWPLAGREFWRIVPPESTWPDDYQRFIAGRFLLQLVSLPEVRLGDAERLIRAFTMLPLVTDEVETKEIWLFLWNLFAAWHERGRPFSDRFRGLQHPEFWDRLLQLVDKRVSRKGSENKLNLLILAGLLRFLVLECTQGLRSIMTGRLIGVKYLLKETDGLRMLPAFFALQGIALLVPPRSVFSPKSCRRLIEKATEYSSRTAALDLVCDWLRVRQEAVDL